MVELADTGAVNGGENTCTGRVLVEVRVSRGGGCGMREISEGRGVTLHTARYCEDPTTAIAAFVSQQIGWVFLLSASTQSVHCFPIQQARTEQAHAAQCIGLTKSILPVRIFHGVRVKHLPRPVTGGSHIRTLQRIWVVRISPVDTDFGVCSRGGGRKRCR